jgi:hypothetical protein
MELVSILGSEQPAIMMTDSDSADSLSRPHIQSPQNRQKKIAEELNGKRYSPLPLGAFEMVSRWF